MTEHRDNRILYSEQKRLHPMVQIPVYITAVAAWALFITQVLIGGPIGGSTLLLGVAWVVMIIFGLALPLLSLLMSLKVEVRRDALNIRFTPFTSRQIPMEQVRSSSAQKEHEVTDNSGWGFSTGRDGSYHIHGSRGVRVLLQDESLVTIGSDHPDELSNAIEEARSS